MGVIYQPKGRAAEYAAWAVNIYRGCGHRCAYCYAPNVLRMNRDEFHNEPRLRKDFFKRLESSAKAHAGLKERVLLCFTCDAYQPLNDETHGARRTIKILHRYDIHVTILTKAGINQIEDDLFDLLTEQDAVAVSLTVKDEITHDWEPGAVVASGRIDAVMEAQDYRLETWASFEPVIFPEHSLYLLDCVGPYISHCKVGPLNYARRLPEHLRQQVPENIDWTAFAHEFQRLADAYDVEVYFKRDLQDLLQKGRNR